MIFMSERFVQLQIVVHGHELQVLLQPKRHRQFVVETLSIVEVQQEAIAIVKIQRQLFARRMLAI